ncbi:hypothetical protein BC937DRAFT_93881 [Endogone sp. FLAS-F59071]|nr:hypothetical protein BC937DRAFT_93881 [Endogone sp. FLAS-F59071]|eukprot:RUS14398.1 hypothetical protein BC937DRAFT_93881 [Endogone sp. FLAS-F59071]
MLRGRAMGLWRDAVTHLRIVVTWAPTLSVVGAHGQGPVHVVIETIYPSLIASILPSVPCSLSQALAIMGSASSTLKLTKKLLGRNAAARATPEQQSRTTTPVPYTQNSFRWVDFKEVESVHYYGIHQDNEQEVYSYDQHFQLR